MPAGTFNMGWALLKTGHHLLVTTQASSQHPRPLTCCLAAPRTLMKSAHPRVAAVIWLDWYEPAGINRSLIPPRRTNSAGLRSQGVRLPSFLDPSWTVLMCRCRRRYYGMCTSRKETIHLKSIRPRAWMSLLLSCIKANDQLRKKTEKRVFWSNPFLPQQNAAGRRNSSLLGAPSQACHSLSVSAATYW